MIARNCSIESFLIVCFLITCSIEGFDGATKKRGGMPFEDCGSIYDVSTVQLSSCKRVPCPLRINAPAPIYAEFGSKAGINSAYLQHEAYWVANGVVTPLPLNPNGCEGRACPFRTSVGFGFQEKAFVTEQVPAGRGSLVWRSRDWDRSLVICFRIPVYFIHSLEKN